ncbi:MAG: flagellar hook-length control protein FliK [Pseudorhodoplanes sp.]
MSPLRPLEPVRTHSRTSSDSAASPFASLIEADEPPSADRPAPPQASKRPDAPTGFRKTAPQSQNEAIPGDAPKAEATPSAPKAKADEPEKTDAKPAPGLDIEIAESIPDAPTDTVETVAPDTASSPQAQVAADPAPAGLPVNLATPPAPPQPPVQADPGKAGDVSRESQQIARLPAAAGAPVPEALHAKDGKAAKTEKPSDSEAGIEEERSVQASDDTSNGDHPVDLRTETKKVDHREQKDAVKAGKERAADPENAKDPSLRPEAPRNADNAAAGSSTNATTTSAPPQTFTHASTTVTPAAATSATPAPNAATNAPPVPITGLGVEIAAQSRNGKSRFEIRLDPPELGRIDVRLDMDRDGRVTSRLVVERSETLDLLRRDAPQLERALEQAGLKTSDNGLQFSLRDQQQQTRQEQSPRMAQMIIADPEIPDSALRQYGRPAGQGGGLDIRV